VPPTFSYTRLPYIIRKWLTCSALLGIPKLIDKCRDPGERRACLKNSWAEALMSSDAPPP